MSNTEVKVTITMEKSFCDIFFRVFSKSDNQPIKDVEVEILTDTGESVMDGKTDANGNWTVTDMPSGVTLTWVCRAKGFKDTSGTVTTL